MTQTLSEPKQVKLALAQIADARELLRLASDVLSAFGATEAMVEPPPAVVREGRQLEIGDPPQDLLDIAHEVIHQVFPEQLAQRALQHGTTPRDWLYRVYAVSCIPRSITEPVTTLVVMLAAVKFRLAPPVAAANRDAPGTPAQNTDSAARPLPGNFHFRDDGSRSERCSLE